MTYRTARPAEGGQFHDRVEALARLERVSRSLVRGESKWLVLFGHRKIGKTSLLREAARRLETARLRFVLFDVFETMPVSLDVFRRFAAHVLDACLVDLGASARANCDRPTDLRAALMASKSFARLPTRLRTELLELGDRPADAALARFALDLPEQLAQALGLHVVVTIDEFQELAVLGSARKADPLPLMRSLWQKHARVAYVVSGSSRSMLTELVSSERSPFFQHFDPMELGPFEEKDAIALVTEAAPKGRAVPVAIARRAYEILSGSPFYLSLFGDALTTLDPPYDDDALEAALREVLFSPTGRLSLYFDAEHQRIVGRSAGLAAVLDALAEGPLRASDVGTRIRADSGTTVRSLERLRDTVEKQADGRYAIVDRAYAAWLRWRGPRGTAVPMSLVGDEAERLVAETLASLGFDLVYQSRASRGTFDLLAMRGRLPLGVQVKRSPVPLRFTANEWKRLQADGKRFGWRAVVASVSPEGDVVWLDPGEAKRGKEIRLTETAAIENLGVWLDSKKR
ncbi:MAG: ATP-binding protein [Deltaproteobacteria bacterium]|nr:ATP-binding protein [Deltaproteobacteria bacterium]